MGNGGHGGAELVGSRVEARAEEDRDQEQNSQDGHIPEDRADGDDGDPDQSRLELALHWERLDEQVADDEKRGETDGADDLANDNRLPRRSRHVARQLPLSATVGIPVGKHLPSPRGDPASFA